MTSQISPSDCLGLLESLDIGAPVAEDDNLLFESRVETAVFSELLRDNIDIVRGTKGSGKSALYRLFADFLASHLLEGRKTLILQAVEMKGDPIFLKFREHFAQLDEIAFEDFWRIYFVSLVTSRFLGEPQVQSQLGKARAEVTRFKALAKEKGFPVQEARFSIPALVGWVLSKVPRVKRIEAGMRVDSTPQVAVEFEGPPPKETRVPVFVGELHEALIAVLAKADLRLWIMLDRLDEAFPRRSQAERTALRALLRSTQAFKTSRLRLKIFLRDDIFDSVTDTAGGYVALTHVMSRCSKVLSWNRQQVLQLITNRVFPEGSRMARYFQVAHDRLRSDEAYRSQCFYKVFPERMRAGSRQSSTLDWLYKHCEDANGVVTPRDLIDLINAARGHQLELLRANSTAMPCVLSPAAVLFGHQEMSNKKKTNFLKAEFDHFWRCLEKFQNQKAEHDDGSLRRLLGEDYGALKDLMAIGFLKHNPRAGTYTIPFLYRPGLGIRQGKSAARARAR